MCVPSLFLIFEKNNKTKESSFNITINNIKGSKNEYCKYIRKTPFILCGSTSLEVCKSCENDMCSSIQCGKDIENPMYNIDKFETYNELCVPRNISDTKKKSMCKNFKGVNAYRIFYECDYNIKYSFPFMTSEFYLLIIFIILGLSFIIIYYNNYLIKKKQKHYNMPSIFPESLFPNDINNEYQKMKNGDTYKYNNI